MISIPNTANGEFVCNVDGTHLSVLYVTYPIELEEICQKPLHNHLYYEFMYIFVGTACLHSERGDCTLQAGDCVLISPECKHKIADAEECIALKVGISKLRTDGRGNRAVTKFFERLDAESYVLITDSERKKGLGRLFPDFAESVNSPYRVRASFVNLIYYLCECVISREEGLFFSAVGGHDPKDMICNVLLYQYTTDVTAKDVGNSVFLSERQVNRICNRIFGRSFVAQKTFYRIENAKNLLKNSDRSVLSISEECGFSSLSGFYSAFGKQEGISPGKYRESIGKTIS